MKKNLKTIKLLSCLSTVNHIINENWLKDSNYYSKFISKDIFTSVKNHKIRKKSLSMNNS